MTFELLKLVRPFIPVHYPFNRKYIFFHEYCQKTI